MATLFSLAALLFIASPSFSEISTEEMTKDTHIRICNVYDDKKSKCIEDPNQAREQMQKFLDIAVNHSQQTGKPNFGIVESKTFGESPQAVSLFEYAHRSCKDVFEPKSHEICHQIASTGVGIFGNTLANTTLNERINNLSITLLEKPGSESWVLQEYTRIYALACHQLENITYRDVCLRGSKQIEPALLSSIISGDMFKKLKDEYTSEKKGHRRRRFTIAVFLVPALIVGAVAVGAVATGTYFAVREFV